MVVSRSVRFSLRPCPLSVLLASIALGIGSNSPLGGKSRGGPPRLLPEGQPGVYVYDQAELVVLGEEEVVPSPVDDLVADVTLAEQGVAGDDTAFQGQNAQKLQGGLVLVGLGIDLDLGQHGLAMRGVGGHEVLPGYLALSA